MGEVGREIGGVERFMMRFCMYVSPILWSSGFG